MFWYFQFSASVQIALLVTLAVAVVAMPDKRPQSYNYEAPAQQTYQAPSNRQPTYEKASSEVITPKTVEKPK